MNKKEIIVSLEKGEKKYLNLINSLIDTELLNYYCNSCNNSTGNNYTNEYILGNKSSEEIRNKLLDLYVTEHQVDNLLQALKAYKNDTSNYAFSFVTGLGYGTHEELFDEPTVEFLETADGFQWVAHHC